MSKITKCILVFLFIPALLLGQHATGYSPPTRLGNVVPTSDYVPPVINIINVGGAVYINRPIKRGIRVVPDAQAQKYTSDFVTFTGEIKDNYAVAALKINNKPVRLRGRGSRKRFAVKLRRPAAGRVFTLRFEAKDKAGNVTHKEYELRGPDAANSAPVFALRKEPDKSDQPELLNQARYWALVIGVQDYPHPSVSDLSFPVRDAQDIARVLTQAYTFEPSRVELLINPTRAQLVGALAAYTHKGRKALGKNDNLLVFYAGHGYWDEQYREGYWLPSNAEQRNRANWVSNSDIQKTFRASQARHILLLSDACFAGSLLATRNPFTDTNAGSISAMKALYNLPSRRAITAGNFTEVPDQSAYKFYLLRRLQQNHQKYLDAGSLFNAVKLPIIANSKATPRYGVIQETGDEGGEFIFVRRE